MTIKPKNSMKRIHTQARKARRASSFRSTGAHSVGSALRRQKRLILQPKRPKTYGFQVVRTQRIFLKKDRFGAPIYRTIKHAKTSKTAIAEV